MDLHNQLLNAKAWPCEEARKVVKRVDRLGRQKVIFETGYGPSGLPHIGTFGEVLRTTMVMQAFRKMSDIPAKLVVFSDDMDGFRKVPTNVPQQGLLEQSLGKPLVAVPDPYGQYESFAHHNNAMLRRFLDSFHFEYEFKSSAEAYKSGEFNECLKKILVHYGEIMDIMLPTLREERRQTYSPILPISPTTGQVLQVHIDDINLDDYTVIFQDPATNKREEISVLDGHCKLQWKADWGMRWSALSVDYEMNGKDLVDSFKLSAQICRIIGGTPPENLVYELFLDEHGLKISKSKGNGLSIDEWLKYAPQESLAYYMYQSPQRAKRLFFDVIPLAMDEYLEALQKYPNLSDEEKIGNAVYHIHNGNPPEYAGGVRFSLLLNLVQACNTADENVLMQFVLKYLKSPSEEARLFMRKLAHYAVAYYNDFVAGARAQVAPTPEQRSALQDLKQALQECGDEMEASQFQNIVFEVGKKYYANNLREWFKALYQILFGTDNGPRMGSFIELYGRRNTIALLEDRINGN